jgi:hypothetical protein
MLAKSWRPGVDTTTKSDRTARSGIYETVDPDLVAGVVLGTRAPKTVIDVALAVQRSRPNFIVRKVTSTSCSYALDAYDVDANSWRYGHML